jgi:eukaryotic-like serine/threonine-protein kinase
VISSPAAENGLEYVGSTDKNFYAVDQQTGALKWKFATQGPVVSSPAVATGISLFRQLIGQQILRTGRGEWPAEMEI